jgi:predicted lysophospholipase L1 biosynthesis ABC-type transport system permease subunit
VYFGRNPPYITEADVVGIVEDVRQAGLSREPGAQVFINAQQRSAPPKPDGWGPYFAIRTDGDPTTLVAHIRDAVQQIDEDVMVDRVATMDDLTYGSISRQRILVWLLVSFATTGLALAAIGIYSVMAYSVVQRRREIGVRIALGAERVNIVKLVIGQAMSWTVAGVLLGLTVASMVTRYLESMLFGLTPLDPTTFAAVALLFAVVATLAAYVPTRRATRIDPMVALRCE